MARRAPPRQKGEAPTRVLAERQKGETVPPTRTLQLVQSVGVTKAAKDLGVSTTTLHKARKQQQVSKVIEVAAEGILSQADGHTSRAIHGSGASVDMLTEQTGKVLYLLQVDADKGHLVERLGKMLQADVLRA